MVGLPSGARSVFLFSHITIYFCDGRTIVGRDPLRFCGRSQQVRSAPLLQCVYSNQGSW
ncbi:unnamed protein product [Chondrus crispus]|uniref:Uncharacterized protein n=1 Tax=Chondrus crispus TaxID=2769 RepID=R7Q2W4_CHOCR|nr:unnamed protein product [Chondrus crispus]CDF32369.1 unnamed protein product [Chondrus crispus]|eukprot:XP_005712034.1 unnamed protein product [Chondrus crispus]